VRAVTVEKGDMLVAAPERWDEACFVVPAVRALMASGLSVGVMCLPEQLEFWKTLPGLKVIERTRKAKQLALMLAGNWQAALLWEDGFASDAAVMAKVPRRLGPAGGKLAKRLTHPLKSGEMPLDHRVRFYLSALEGMGVASADPDFFAPAEIGVPPVRQAVLLSPESDFGPSHEWPLERWLEIARKLMDRGYRVTVAGVDDRRRGAAESLAGQLGGGVEFFRAVPLAGALPLLAVHSLVIAADASLPHLAAHAGATCITLFGPNDPQWKRPLGRRHAVVRRHVECAPCLMAKCPLDLRCQRELEVDRVWAAVSEKLAGG
jgi:ADP-heptose:LPS heptosyltransferase